MLFSIIIPTYNRADKLKNAIQSVLAQSCENWELIVVDDGSTDHTAEIIKNFNNPKIIYLYQKNQERSAARNKGIENAKGEWICFLDSDDCYKPNHLDVLNKHLSNASNNIISVIRTFCTEVRLSNKTNQIIVPLKSHPVNYLFESLIYPSSLCIHKKILEENKFDTNISLGEDSELLCRIFTKYPLQIINEHTVNINKDDENTQSNLSAEKQYQYYINLRKPFFNPALRNYINSKSLFILLSNRLHWSILSYKKEGKKLEAVFTFFKHIGVIVRGKGVLSATKLLISVFI